MLRLIRLSVAMTLLGVAVNTWAQAAPDSAMSAVRVVEIQLDALRHNDEPHPDAGIERTWAFAHPANRAVTGPLDRFAAMIKSPNYRMLLNHREHDIKRVAVTKRTALFAVTVLPANGEAVHYQWRLEKVPSGAWMTVMVSPPVRREDAI